VSRLVLSVVAIASLTASLTACDGGAGTGPDHRAPALDLVYERVAPSPASELFVLRDAVGTPQRLLPANTLGGQPSPSADGRLVAFIGAGPSDADPQDVWLMRADGSERRRVALAAGLEFAPALSPDGARVAFIRIGDDDVSRLFVANVDGSGERELAAETPGTFHATPAWSPDGRRLAFAAGEAGALSLWVVDADGRDLARLTAPEAATDFDPAWSPDGTRLAFVRTTGPRQASILVLDLVTRAQRTLVPMAHNRHPAWSPDGARIAFVSTIDGGDDQELYTVAPDGSARVRLTTNDADERRPAWLVRGAS
jgi:TolB protein